MSNRQGQNSILILTTLGVYLGLMLVGATPVLGHAATTRHFEITDEIEITDDLDKKPDEESSIDQFASCFEELVRVAAEWSSKNAPDSSSDDLLSFNYFVSVKPSGAARHFAPSPVNYRQQLSLGKNHKPLQGLYDAFLPRESDWNEKFLVQFEFGVQDISLKATISEPGPIVADSAADAYSKAIARRLAGESLAVRFSILQSTQVTAEGDRVIIVARLPRAGLDPLPAKNAN